MAQRLTTRPADATADPALIPARWLLPARLVFLAVLLLTVLFFSVGLPEYYRQLTTVCASPPCGVSPALQAVQAYQAAGISVEAAARWQLGLTLFAAILPGLVALLIFWRRSANRMAWFTAITVLTFGAFGIHDTTRLASVVAPFAPIWRALAYALAVCGGTCLLVFFFVFPDGRFQPRHLRGIALALLVQQIAGQIFPGTWVDITTWPVALALLYWCGLFGVIIYAQVYRYRRVSTFQQRQQTKWVLLGLTSALVGTLALYIPMMLAPRLNPAWGVLVLFADSSYYLFLPLLPLSIGFAMFRSGLWDVDVVINRALVYGLLTALLAGIYAGLIIVTQALFTRFTGQTSDLALIGSTLAIVALFQPLRRAVTGFIARRFYRRHYDGQQVLTAFAGLLRDRPYTDPDDLSRVLLNLVDETIQPAHVTLRLLNGRAQPEARKPGASS
jgi:hypothetical protein